MTKKTQTRDLQITFIYQFKKATKTAWPDKFRLCWYFNPETLDYVYEHKNKQFVTNGFVISDGLANQLPEELRMKYLDLSERCLLLELQIVSFINLDDYKTGKVFTSVLNFGFTRISKLTMLFKHSSQEQRTTKKIIRELIWNVSGQFNMEGS
jgi:hypothetical protein